MKNTKGQALIEFVLILPIILILIFTTIDIFNLVLKKNDLDKEVVDQLELYNSNKITLDGFKEHFSKDVKVNINIEDKYIEIIVTKSHKWISPITNLIIPSKNIVIKRVIPNEQ